MNGTANEKILARGRLPPAIFIVPVIAVIVAALPAVFVLLIIHALTDLLSQLLHLQIRLFDGYFYIFAFLPGILLSVPLVLVIIVAFRKSTGAKRSGPQPTGEAALALRNDDSR